MGTTHISDVLPLFGELSDQQLSAVPVPSHSVLPKPSLQPKKPRAHAQAEMFDELAAMREIDAWRANSAGYLPSALLQASLPYRDPGNLPHFHKSNGDVSLVIQPGSGVENKIILSKSGQEQIQTAPFSYGYPYGSIPRLLLAWLTTEAITNKKKTIQLGKNLSHFMGTLGMNNVSGGANGSISRLKDQTNRLFAAHITLVRNNRNASRSDLVSKPIQITSQNSIWNTHQPAQPDGDNSRRSSVFGSTVTLSDDFFEELVTNPVPLDFRALRYLRASPLALDIYSWLTWSMFHVRRDTEYQWATLYNQFGSTSSERKFRENFRAALVNVQEVYPEAVVVQNHKALILRPSPTHVPIKRTQFALRA